MAEEKRRQTTKELLGSTSTSTWYKPPEMNAGEHYYKEIAKQNPRNSKARRAILDRYMIDPI